jgi:group I intron endonuclease
MPEKSGIYRIVCIPTGKKYIGSSVNIKARLREHFAGLRRGTHRNPYLQHAFNKYGMDGFKAEPLFYCGADDRLILEQMAIEAIKPEFNAHLVVEGRLHNTPEHSAKIAAANRGRKNPPITEETRAKLSAAHKGKPQPKLKGRKYSVEHRAAISAGNKGKTRSDAYKKNLSEKMKGNTNNKNRVYTSGYKLSEETKAKMRASSRHYAPNKGKHVSEATRAKIISGLIGRPVSAETRAKIGKANKGRNQYTKRNQQAGEQP